MGARVLVIDDDPVNVDLLDYLLRAFSHEPLRALSGAAALQILESEIPDLILCDIQMPQMDGFEFFRTLRAGTRFRSVPVVGVTALAMVGDREKIIAAGFDGYLTKPIAPETFIQEIEKYLSPALVSNEAPRSCDIAGGFAPDPPSRKAGGYVLVVDDSQPNLDLLHHLVLSVGFDVVAVSDATEALRIARSRTPRLILSDLHMPGRSGVELLEIVKGDDALRAIPFLLISATDPTAEEQKRAIASGAAGFLHRPLDPETMLEQITRWIETEDGR